MDEAAWQQAGLYDPAAAEAGQRRELLQFLAAEGCTLEEMVAAALAQAPYAFVSAGTPELKGLGPVPVFEVRGSRTSLPVPNFGGYGPFRPRRAAC